MKKTGLFLVIYSLFFVTCSFAQSPSLSKEEIKDGWIILFDGKTLNGWNNLKHEGWEIHDGVLSAQTFTDGRQRDIITQKQFGSFELSLEFKIAKETNSGIKYLVTDDYPGYQGQFLGLEYQILDEANFVYPDRGEYRTTASLYDLIPSDKKEVVPLNKWNTARIIVHGNHVEHWLNGHKVVTYERGNGKFKALVAQSKYKNYIHFGEKPTGHILLQNEGSPVDFKNIKIKLLN